MENNQNKRLDLKFNQDEYDLIKDFSERNGLSITDLIEKATSNISHFGFSDFKQDSLIPLHAIVGFVYKSLEKKEKLQDFSNIISETKIKKKQRFYMD